MFENLIKFEPDASDESGFTPLGETCVKKVIDAQFNSTKWLEDMGVPSDKDVDQQGQVKAARDAFSAVTYNPDSNAQKQAVIAVKTPDAVRHLTGMLTAYDWEFVNHAKELRGYAVSKILEETTNPNANIRLKALQMLGNVTEIGLFTERIEIAKKDASEEEIENRLRERLAKFIINIPSSTAPAEVIDVKAIDEEISQVVTKRDD
jgi:hypothetical protein